jgi:hypothetical protein
LAANTVAGLLGFGDRERLQSIIATLIAGEADNSGDSPPDASASDTGAAFGQDDTEFTIFNTDRKLAALQTAAKMLATLNEKKSLIYFSGGLFMHWMRIPAMPVRCNRFVGHLGCAGRFHRQEVHSRS